MPKRKHRITAYLEYEEERGTVLDYKKLTRYEIQNRYAAEYVENNEFDPDPRYRNQREQRKWKIAHDDWYMKNIKEMK